MKRILFAVFVASAALWNMTAAGQSSPRPVKIALHPTLNIVAVASGTELKFSDLDTGEIVRTITGFESLGYDLAWDASGSKLAVTDASQVEIWTDPLNPETTAPTSVISYLGIAKEPRKESYVRLIAWSPDSTQIAIAVGSYISIWEAAISKLQLEIGDGWLDLRLDEYRYFSLVTGLAWPQNDRLLFTGADGEAFLYSLSNQAVNQFAGAPTILLKFPFFLTLALSNSKQKAAFPETDADMIYIWDLSENSEYFTPMSAGIFYGDSTAYITAIAWRQDDRVIASVGDDRKLHLWDVETGEQYEVISLSDDASLASIVWTHDGTQLIYATVEGEIAFITPENLPLLEAMEAVIPSP